MKKRSHRQKAKLAWKIFLIACAISGGGALLFAATGGCMSFGGGAPSTHCSSQNDFESTLGGIGFFIMGIGWLFLLPTLFFVTIYHQMRKWFSKNPDAIE